MRHYLCSLLIFACSLSVHARESLKTFHPETAWSFNSQHPIYAASAIKADRVYIANSGGVVFGLNRLSGKEIWRFTTAGPIYSDVSLSAKGVYVQSDDGYLYKLNQRDGKLIWKTQVNTQNTLHRPPIFSDAGWDYRSSAAVEYDGQVLLGSADHHLYSLDATTGKILWKFKSDASIRATPMVAEQQVVFGSFGGFLYNLDVKTGKQKWVYDTNQIVSGTSTLVMINSQATLHQGVVYVGSRDTNLYAVDMQTGQLKWFYPYRDSWIESPATIVDNVVHLGSSFKRAQVALDATNGELIWQTNVAKGLSFARQAVTNDAVYAGTVGVGGMQYSGFLTDGGLLKLDRKSGQEIWRFPLALQKNKPEHGVLSAPQVTEEMIYFGGLDGLFYALVEKTTAHAIYSFEAQRDQLTPGETTRLSWDVLEGVEVRLNGNKVANTDSLLITPTQATHYTLTTAGNITDKQQITVDIMPAAQINLARFGIASASSIETNNPALSAKYAIDSDKTTRWSSEWADPQWITVDLGKPYTLGRVVLNWEGAFSSHYQLAISDDNQQWQTFYEQQQGSGKIEDITTSATGRYVRLLSAKRATQYGVSLYEFEVYEKDE
ncbi:PQQ-binding-like beta-propeller repeat protein [Alteromonadaceae bacterium BrNp21-10]|nr:PQQ-binding-like beta-propeller repeat protein [Alteromonadaceae bacterium BrNp21-10]